MHEENGRPQPACLLFVAVQACDGQSVAGAQGRPVFVLPVDVNEPTSKVGYFDSTD